MKLINTREHDITLHDGKESVTVPAARQDENDRSKKVPGVAEADETFVSKLREKFDAVEHYFAEGWLKIAGKKEAVVDADDDDKGGKKKK